VLDLVFSVLCQEIGWEERLQNDLFCVEWDVRPLPVIMIGFMWLTLLLLLQTAQRDYCQKAVSAVSGKPGQPGRVGEVEIGQGNVRELMKAQGKVGKMYRITY